MSANKPVLKIYHTEGRRSERLAWYCEETGYPYELIFKSGDLYASLALGKAVNPLMAMFPTVSYDGEILVESSAILQLLHDRHGDNLAPDVESADYPKYLQWFHFAESSAAPRLIMEFMLVRATAGGEMPAIAKHQIGRGAQVMTYMEDYLQTHPYFGGANFSLADIMMHFDINFASMVAKHDMSPYPKLMDWFARVEARPAFKKMREVSLPNGFIGVPA